MRRRLQSLVAFALGDLPEQVAHVDVAVVPGHADRRQVRFTRSRSSASSMSWKFAWRRLSVQTLQTVSSVSAPVSAA